MTLWRRKAFETFPLLRDELASNGYSIYMLFFDLLPMAMQAHADGNEDLLGQIYAFAEWCFCQDEKDLWNAAGVAFYEHLFDEPNHWEDIVRRLSLNICEGCWGLWTVFLSEAQLQRLETLIRGRFPAFVVPR